MTDFDQILASSQKVPRHQGSHTLLSLQEVSCSYQIHFQTSSEAVRKCKSYGGHSYTYRWQSFWYGVDSLECALPEENHIPNLNHCEIW